jgi:hypothetical protein
MHRYRVLYCVVLSLASIGLLAPSPTSSTAVPSVPLASLITDGEKFDSTILMTAGFAAVGPRGAALYLSEGAARYGLLSLGIPIDLSDLAPEPDRFADAEKRLQNNWVSVRARYQHFPSGSEAAGGLTNVEAIVVFGPGVGTPLP